ncbi:hypothetical protein K2F40_09875 [Clostridium sp. CM028]|uniref:DUF6514 family protein n=1 Tax=Clostridium TaxID=1485 RepID=UPI0013EE4FED|nr:MULTISPECIES: DUF6514 family protein [Clostridium]MBU3091702.1 hypothetical protein [Clostridium sp. CF011]MBW9144797.1 hypothetical protein [Clostridium sp. CM027]MBW9149267.1 hypothetical protein [Clostridium sp. CM028]MBZ9609267.1 DUF6514 family protein [Clostridium estertheticum]UVE40456.1 hypothetical protein KTC92_15225 [Clostridium sp. CM027]
MVVIENLLRKVTDGDVNHNYFYRLVKSQISVSMYGELTEIQAYGIEIERQDIVDGSVVGIQRDCVENISPQRHKVKNLLKMLYDNTVSPIHMIDILGDYIDEYTSDFDEILKNIATC